MRIGPIQISRAYAQKPSLPDTSERGRELGAPGTLIFSGLLSQEEYNSDLRGEAGLKIYERMFKSDPTVRAVEKVITLPIRGAYWDMVPPTEDPEDKEIAEFCESVLFSMKYTWDDTLRHILYMLRYGRYPFEQVWELDEERYGEQRIILQKLAPRMPRTVARWYLDEFGGFAGIEQRTWKITKESSGVGKIPVGEFKLIDLDANRLVLFVNDREASNYEGESIARPMYKPWYLKEGVERIMAIGVERREIGVEYAKMAPDATKAQENAVAEVLASLHAQERGYVVFPPTVAEQGVFASAQGRSNSVLFLDYLRREIGVSGLAEFVTMGASGGSWAMHRDKSSFFLLANRAVVNNVTDTLNSSVIKRLCDINFNMKGREYPQLSVSRLETRNVQEFAAAVQSMAQSGMLSPDSVTEAAIRMELDLPEKPELEEGEVEGTPPGAPTPADPNDPEHMPGGMGDDEGIPEEAGMSHRQLTERRARQRQRKRTRSWRGYRTYWREPTMAERHVNLSAIDDRMDRGIEEVLRVTAPVQKRQINKLVEIAEAIVEKGDMDRLDRVDIPYSNEMAGALSAVLQDLYDFGKEQVAHEMGVNVSELADAADFIAKRSKAVVGVMNAKVKSSFVYEALVQLRTGLFDKVKLLERLSGLSDKELQKSAAFSVNEAFNLGRKEAADKVKKEIAYAEYSAILDSNTCEPCADRDGNQFEVGSDEYEENLPPLKDCEGGNQCRCLYVYVSKEEGSYA